MLDLKRLPLFLMVLALAFVTYTCSDNTTQTQIDLEPEFNHKVAPGDSAESFLQGDQYTALELEIDYMEGYKPTQEALDSLEAFLSKYLNKGAINIGPPTSISAKGQNAYSTQDIVDLEEQHRNHFTKADSDTLWAYFLVVDGEYTTQNVLGIAYYNTSMAFFGKTIHDNTRESGQVGTQPERYKMEAIVFNHEIGHNLGLVNNGTPMINDHQDRDHGKHCTQEDCLMYYSVRTTDFFANLFDGTIPDLQQFCQEDIQANGGK